MAKKAGKAHQKSIANYNAGGNHDRNKLRKIAKHIKNNPNAQDAKEVFKKLGGKL